MPLSAHLVQLLIGDLHCLIRVELLASSPDLSLERRGHALAATGQLQVALIGEHHGLRAATCANHDRLGIDATLTEALEHRG